MAFGRHVYPEQVHTEGITQITLADVDYAESWGGVIKLIGQVKMQENGKVQMIVCPMFISRDSQLATVDDVFNGIMVRGDATGDVVFYGKGAGKLPTASAVVADIIDCVKHFQARKYLFWEDGDPNYVEDYLDDSVAMYVRAAAGDHPAAEDAVRRVFGKVDWLSRRDAGPEELAFVTLSMPERVINEKLDELKKAGITIAGKIRIGDF